MNEQGGVPKYEAYLWPMVSWLRAQGGSATIQEIVDGVSAAMGLTEAQKLVPHGKTGRTEVDYRMAWARTYLKEDGLLENSERGVWRLTPDGEAANEELVTGAWKRASEVFSARRRQARKVETSDPIPTEQSETVSWTDKLLESLQNLKPDAFERLCQRALRESGFTKVVVTGKSGDGGIDGTGVLRVNLLSFHVLFQCKRYSGSVGASAVRDFRGAMVGRADKGLIITTGSFTADARREAVRDGAPAIDLIDGVGLCDLLKSLKIGVRIEMVEKVIVDENAFASL